MIKVKDEIMAPTDDMKLEQAKEVDILNCVLIGEQGIPFAHPNIDPDREIHNIQEAINNSQESGLGCCDLCMMCITGCTIVGLCFVCKNTILINSDQYGFATKSGDVMFLQPGWHYTGYPLIGDVQKYPISSEYIKVNNLQIIRIKQDEIGVGVNNTELEVLLPGTHMRTLGSYVFKKRYKLDNDIIEGPLKIITVKTGNVCICYNNGGAEILTEGRYAVNSNGFIVGKTLDITQQNLKFSKHKVLLDGGINMFVEGLLTYQIVDVAKMIKNVDITKLNQYLEEIMKADLTKIFSTIHLEQISSTTYDELKRKDSAVSDTRIYIYESMMKMIKPQADEWGVKIINFQLESTQLADQKYSSDYESASLQIAKSKADLKAQEAQNLILKQKAETDATVAQIKAQAEKTVQLIKSEAYAQATILQADADAQAILKEGQAKAEAADMMRSQYGQEVALLEKKSKIADGLKIHTLVMGGNAGGQGGKSLVDNFIPVLNL